MERSTKKVEQSGSWFGEFLRSDRQNEQTGRRKTKAERQEQAEVERAKLRLRRRISLDAMTELLLIDSLLPTASRRARKQLASVAERRWGQYREKMMLARFNGNSPRASMLSVFSWD